MNMENPLADASITFVRHMQMTRRFSGIESFILFVFVVDNLSVQRSAAINKPTDTILVLEFSSIFPLNDSV